MSFVYLLIDPREVDGKRKMYVGLTKNGVWRYHSHLGQESDGSDCKNWMHDMMCNGHVPFHVILERSTALKELQIQEILFIKALRLMGEQLVNFSDGGEPGTTRLRTNQNDFLKPLDLVSVRELVNEIMTKPSDELVQAYQSLGELAKRLGGFQPELERYKVLLAKTSLCNPSAEVIPRKVCTIDGCKQPHHGRGLCRSHGDKKRREQKRAERKAPLVQLSLLEPLTETK